VLRAMTIEEALPALPPDCEIPPAWGPLNPNRFARRFAVYFSMRVRTGDTW
jgi:hypothetical protein